MNHFIETFNQWGTWAFRFAVPMLWQSSVLIALVFAFDFALRRKIRAAIRYALWLVVLLKLLLPPSLALPTGAAWWLHAKPVPPKPREMKVVITRNNLAPETEFDFPELPAVTPPPARFDRTALLLLSSALISFALFGWMLFRWRQISRIVSRSVPASERLGAIFEEAKQKLGSRNPVRLCVTEQAMSPAVCDLFRPVIVLPQMLADKLGDEQLRAVLLHELIHLRRRDVWVNCAQALLQIVYWWHPLLWLANARIRRVREEAVDDAVMLVLHDDAEIYAPTLLEVAKLAFTRPLASLGLVGILESKSALRQRIERLVNFTTPRRAGLSVVSVLAIAAFTAVAVPMGEAPIAASSDATQNSPAAHFDIRIESSGKYFVSSNEISLVQIQTELSKFKKINPNIAVIVRAKKDAPYKAIPPLLETCKNLGVTSFSLRMDENSPTEPSSGSGSNTLGANQTSVGTLIQDGRLLWEVGKANEAEVKFKKALELDPKNEAATYYLKLIAQAEMKQRTAADKRGPLPVPNPNRRTIATGKGRQLVLDKLNQIHFDSVQFDNLPLSEVVRMLASETKNSDPDHRGINFIIDPRQPNSGAVDPATGLAVTNAAAESIDINSVLINLPTTTNLRLADVLDALTQIADRPIKYSIEDYGVVFSLKDPNAPAQLFTRRFKVAPKLFYAELQKNGLLTPEQSDTGGTTSVTNRAISSVPNNAVAMEQVQQAVHKYFAAHEINLDSPKAVFFNDRQGTLLVRATEEDLRRIEELTPLLTTYSADNPQTAEVFTQGQDASHSPPESPLLQTRRFKVDPERFFRNLEAGGILPKGENYRSQNGSRYFASTNSLEALHPALLKFFASIGVEMKPPKSVFFHDRNGDLLVRATAEDLDLIETAIQTLNTPLAQVNIKVRFVEADPSEAGTFGIEPYLNSNNSALTNGSFTGILTDPQFRIVLKALEQRKGNDLLSQGDVTTLSGRQAQIQINDMKTIVVTGLETNLPFGSTLDVIPNVSADGETIQMTVIPTVTEFLGYDDPGPAQTADGVQFRSRILPKIRIRQMKTTANVWDGQTLVLGNFSDKMATIKSDDAATETPFTGTKKKQLLVFITPTIIDAAGNRVHSEDELPFAKNQIPPEPNEKK